MICDFELAWVKLKAELAQKRSWGADQVVLTMAKLEVDCMLPEGERDFDPRPAPSGIHQPSDGVTDEVLVREPDMASH